MALKKKAMSLCLLEMRRLLAYWLVSFKNLGDDFVLCKLKCNFLPRFTGYFLRGSKRLDFDF